MKKVLVTLVLVMTLGVSVSFAQAAPVEVPVVEKPQQSKKLVFSEIYMNDVPEAVMDRLALEGAMIKQAFMAYGIDGSRIYKINVFTLQKQQSRLQESMKWLCRSSRRSITFCLMINRQKTQCAS